jgi:excisionase family DNA binding protein
MSEQSLEAVSPLDDPERIAFRVDEVAKMTGMTKRSIYRDCEAGKIPANYVGWRVMIPRAWVERFSKGEIRY